MSLSFHRIVNQEDKFLSAVLDLYGQTFPSDERRHKADFIAILASDKRFHCLAFFDHDVFIGFITVWKFDFFTYCEHFSIKTIYRSKGYGKCVLQQVIKNGFAPFLCEVEPPDTPEKQRRIAFYLKQGFVLQDIGYIQPPYSKDKNSLPMQIMTFDFNKNRLPIAIDIIKKEVYNFDNQ